MLLLLASTAVEATASPSSSRTTAGARCLASTLPADLVVVLYLVDRHGLTPVARKELLRETVDLWHAAGVKVRWSRSAEGNGHGEAPGGTRHVHVRIMVLNKAPDDQRSSEHRSRPLASIPFVNTDPVPLISAYPAEVERLLKAARLNDRFVAELPAILRDRLAGRVLGRAVAHELGHFLFASKNHAPSGLMRPTHPISRLLAPFRRGLRVVAPDATGCLEAGLR
jgi:hypothetical protein